jgi:phenylpyruvate tautomerase
MPLLTVQTNISVEEKSKELLDLLTDVIAEGTGKPKAYISILLDDNKVMSFGGTTEPCAIISLGSIGAIEGKQKLMSKSVMTILQDQVGIGPDRCYMFFQDVKGKDVGFNLTTFG